MQISIVIVRRLSTMSSSKSELGTLEKMDKTQKMAAQKSTAAKEIGETPTHIICIRIFLPYLLSVRSILLPRLTSSSVPTDFFFCWCRAKIGFAAEWLWTESDETKQPHACNDFIQLQIQRWIASARPNTRNEERFLFVGFPINSVCISLIGDVEHLN